MFLLMFECEADKNNVSMGEWLCALAFLALCKVGFVSGFCAPCNVLKIALGSVGKVLGCVQLLRCVQIG